MLNYSLEDINEIIFNGFDFKVPNETIELIQQLTKEVGSPLYIKTPVFKKCDKKTLIKHNLNKKNQNIEKEWELLRVNNSTKLKEKVGLELDIDIIRVYLNKLTNKNFNDNVKNIVNKLDELIENKINNEELLKISKIIFHIASSNRFYSKLYANLYSILIEKYDIMNDLFKECFESFIELFTKIEYVNPEDDYDKFCKINNDNEIRKSLSSFFVNLSNNNILSKEKLIKLVYDMFSQLLELIEKENNKSQVDEITENISIMYSTELFKEYNIKLLNDLTINETIEKLSKTNIKNHKSITNKSIFKFMDMFDLITNNE